MDSGVHSGMRSGRIWQAWVSGARILHQVLQKPYGADKQAREGIHVYFGNYLLDNWVESGS